MKGTKCVNLVPAVQVSTVSAEAGFENGAPYTDAIREPCLMLWKRKLSRFMLSLMKTRGRKGFDRVESRTRTHLIRRFDSDLLHQLGSNHDRRHRL